MNRWLEDWITGGSGVPDPVRCLTVLVVIGAAVFAVIVAAVYGVVHMLDG